MGFQYLCESLNKNNKLQTLDLKDNKLTGKASEYLSKTLKTNKSLVKLLIGSKKKISYHSKNQTIR